MMKDALTPVIDQQLSQQVRDRLKQYIIQEGLQPGDKLPSEAELSRRLGVSRTPLREALRSMEALGLIEARQGVGRVVRDFTFEPLLDNLAYVFAFQNRTILHAMQIRSALDASCVELAMPELTVEDLAELAVLVHRMKENIAAGTSITSEDIAFHKLLYERAGNPLAQQLFEIMCALRINALDQEPYLREVPPGTAENHEAILEALKERDADKARERIVAHHSDLESRLRRRIAQEGETHSEPR